MFNCVNYFRVGYLLHFFSLLEMIVLYIAFKWLNIEDWLQQGNLLLKIVVLLPFISIPFFPQLDAWSRYQNYKMMRDKFYYYGFQVKIAKLFIRSRCQRDAVLAAASDLGYSKTCKFYFYENGYRWFHILPDFILSNPAILLSKQFWQSTFFVKKYSSRVNIRLIRNYKMQNSSAHKMAA